MFRVNILLVILFIATVGCKKEEDLTKKPSDPCASVKKDPAIIADFECQMDNLPMVDATSKEVKLLDNAALEKILNPDKSGVNTSDHVGKFTDDGKTAWDNLFIGKFKDNIDLSTKNVLKIKYRTAVVNSNGDDVKILAKLEGGDDTNHEIWSAAITTDNKWHELSFDFSGQAGKKHKAIVLFFNGGKDKADSKSLFYIDDIKFVSK